MILDYLESDNKALMLLNGYFGDIIASNINSISKIHRYVSVSNSAICFHVKSYYDFYTSIGLKRNRTNYNSYLLNPRTALVLIANYNRSFASYVGYKSIKDLILQYREKLELDKNKQQLENIMNNNSAEMMVLLLSDLEQELDKQIIEKINNKNDLFDIRCEIENKLVELQKEVEEINNEHKELEKEIAVLEKKLNAIKVLKE